MNRRASSLAFRAVLAIALMMGFYLMAIGIALGLLYLPYAELVYAQRVHLKVALFCVIGAAVILWALLPRPDRFEAPGPALVPARQPRLFDMIAGVAGATHQAMPAEVYLVPEVNAWVAQRGGVMGIGSRRAMGLGLPLLQTLSISELRAVLAHEFGHYDGGDTKLGPWIYKTRVAIGRTLQGLAEHSSLLQKPFLWYGLLFLRVSHAVSRRQEFMADALAARTVGARPLREGLKKVHAAATAFGPYWSSEVAPVLQRGFRPPLTEGFGHFVATDGVARAVAESVEQALRESHADPYETHPPLGERLEALRALPEGDRPADDPPALTLLNEAGPLERDLLIAIAGRGSVEQMTPLPWDEVGQRVYLPMWQDVVSQYHAHFHGLTFDALAARACPLVDAVINVLDPDGHEDAEQRARRSQWIVGAALALGLARIGWTIRALPGEPITLRRSSDVVEPFAVVNRLVKGQIDAAEWAGRCAELRLTGLPIVSDAAPSVSVSS